MVERRDLERLSYWQGQMLRSRDFRDDAAFEAQRRWWHNRALHSAFGVSYGLQVALDSTSGEPILTVGCGLAYDCFGRELILREDRPAPPPPPDATTTGAQTLLIQSAPGGAQLVWEPTSNLGTRNGVPLARATFAASGVTLDETFLEPHARAIARPRLATGDTVRGDTPWEPWNIEVVGPEGLPQTQSVGVQTRIDTSAAGFTGVPEYFAELQWPNLTNPSTAAFAPAFFPSIADEEPDGFTFRLLMKGIARKRVAVSFGVSEAAGATLPSAPTAISVEDAAGFQAGDVIARVRPRGLLAAAVASSSASSSGTSITLATGLDNVGEGDMLAIGNVPRFSVVTKTPSQETVSAFELTPPLSVRPGDLLADLGPPLGPAPVRVLDVEDGLIILDSNLPTLKTGDAAGLAKQADAFPITTVETDAGTGVMTVTMVNAAPFSVNDAVFQLTSDGTAGAVAAIQSIAGNVLTLKNPIAGLSNTDQLGRISLKSTVSGIVQKPLVQRVTVQDASVFRAGDIVARLDGGGAVSAAAVIEKIDHKRNTVTLASRLQIDVGNTLGAANASASSNVVNTTANGPVVASPANFQAGDVVYKWAESGDVVSPSVVVGTAGDGALTLQPAGSFTSGDILVAQRFPRTATILRVFPYDVVVLVNVDNSTAFRAGDTVMRVSDSSQTAGLSLVVPYFPGWLILFNPISDLKANDQLALVAFDKVATVASPPSDARHLKIDRTLDLRTGDVVAPLTAFAETSSEASIVRIEITGAPNPDKLTLTGPIDGLLPGDLIGPAALTPTQNSIRFATTDQNVADLRQGDLLLISGLDAQFLQPVNAQVRVSNLDTASGRATLTPVDGSSNLFRPETLSVAALFNANFIDAFVAFAQEQDLYVCWLGCQNETQTPAGCPGATPVSPCTGKGN